jgi:hypothetical protein
MSSIDSTFLTTSPLFSPHAEPIPEAPRSKGVLASDTDTMAPADELCAAEWKPERPLLTPPESLPPPHLQLSDYRLLGVTEVSRELGSKILDTLTLRLQNVKEKIRDFSAENIKKLREASERANTSGFWSILKKVANCLLSAVSIIFGITLFASGGSALIGGAMIASGILSLANFALSELGTWDWVADQLSHDNEDRKKKIAMILPAAFGIVAGGIGLVGSVYSVASGALQFAEKAAFAAEAALSIFGGMTTLGKGIADARLLWTQADLKLIETNLTIARENFSTTIEEVKGSMNDFKNMKAKAKKALDMLIESNIQLVRQV